ncbi:MULTISPECIES: efflux RND transporter periplasmic adaptor subunit [Corallococcus]|uniref:efflux RND transporter periplasmic adaptor subunit n=1 Tax=Corallococcus TaxID=83461 RepID=UPI00117F2A6C|nr:MULTISPECIES: efflux RND transporter periplasmic adaptor subunit [Corallococcus]NBD08066.1 efflux RND transporter periplasmic adaptor subunit [Corallococcus silvisoli]TSC34037.1 efflux RND transporter periplasmic adaptor subunit [Corallococcus sp. Z5C101001]
MLKQSLLGGALAFTTLACGERALPPQEPTAVKVAVVGRAEAGSGARYSAEIQPATRVDLAFKVGGYVESIAKVRGVDGAPRLLQEGDAVREGMELVSLRKGDFQQKLAEAQAALSQARASEEQAQLHFDRTTKLVAGEVATPAQLDTARTQRDSAAGAVAAARARVEEARSALADTALRSPLEGVVLKRPVEVGALAAPGTFALSVAQTRTVRVVFGVPDTVLPAIRLGAPQTVTTQAYAGQSFEGRISRIAPSADPKSRVFEVEVSIPNADQRLRPGMVAALSLSAKGEAVAQELLVPLAAIVRSPKQQDAFAVFVIADGQGARPVARAREVQLGDYLGNIIPVKAGLQAGERIAVQGASLLSDGEPVEVIP